MTLCRYTGMSVNRCKRSNLCDCSEYDEKPVVPGQNPLTDGRDDTGATDHIDLVPNARQTPAVPVTLEDEFTYVRCDVCARYITRRIGVLAPHIAIEALRRGIDAFDLIHRYRQSVHARHEAGLSLDTA